jgi:hypothetical protein
VGPESFQPLPQALSPIEFLKSAGKKGLDPEDYDASRWDERLRALQGEFAARLLNLT